MLRRVLGFERRTAQCRYATRMGNCYGISRHRLIHRYTRASNHLVQQRNCCVAQMQVAAGRGAKSRQIWKSCREIYRHLCSKGRETARRALDEPSISKSQSTAADEIDRRLGTNPLGDGESREDDLRILLIPPLGVMYRVSPADRIVHVFEVWSYRQRR